jgi:hypothetical protein
MREALSMPTGDTRVITRPKLRSGHERWPTDDYEQDDTVTWADGNHPASR